MILQDHLSAGVSAVMVRPPLSSFFSARCVCFCMLRIGYNIQCGICHTYHLKQKKIVYFSFLKGSNSKMVKVVMVKIELNLYFMVGKTILKYLDFPPKQTSFNIRKPNILPILLFSRAVTLQR